jgi:hypothetical protein
MSPQALNPRAKAELILRAGAALHRRLELIHANIRDERNDTVAHDLDHAIDEAAAIVTAVALLKREFGEAAVEASAS